MIYDITAKIRVISDDEEDVCNKVVALAKFAQSEGIVADSIGIVQVICSTEEPVVDMTAQFTDAVQKALQHGGGNQ